MTEALFVVIGGLLDIGVSFLPFVPGAITLAAAQTLPEDAPQLELRDA